jgi:predicted lactoylglutathione lyase
VQAVSAGRVVRAYRKGNTVMRRMIFVNLPVADLDASRAFFTAAGYRFNEPFCDGNALCLEISDSIFAMLLSREFFACFTPRDVADAHLVSETVLCLNADSREAVDELLERALDAGGTALRTLEDRTETGVTYLYGRSYADLDGHIWEILWMDPVLAA